jgi:cysteine desulfurase family protein
MSLESGKALARARFSLAKLLGASDPDRIVFTLNATDALNLAIGGVLSPGDHVVISSMEHNSVTRPIAHRAAQGVECTAVRMDPERGVSPDDVAAAIGADTKLVVMTHASNVTGTLNPVEAIAELCRRRGVLLLVDASQSAGSIPIDVEAMGIDMLAFPGHKGLMGPSGTGGLYIAECAEPAPLRQGGTGVFSELPTQPDAMPYRYESGTQNFHGLAGLDAAARFILDITQERVRAHERTLIAALLEGLREISGVTIYGPPPGADRAPVVSLNIAGLDCAEAAMILDASFGLMLRPGLHCAPDAHRTLGTFDIGGTLRVSPGYFNTEDDIKSCVESIAEVAREV